MANGTTLFFHKCDSYFCVLPKIAQSRAQSQADLAKVEGVGDAKIEKYGRRVLDVISASGVVRP